MFYFELMFAIVFSVLYVYASDERLKKACVIGGVCCLLYVFVRARCNTYKLHLLNVDGINEVLVLKTKLSNDNVLFMLDTGYAGPPVLSRSYIAIKNRNTKSIVEEYKDVMNKMESVSEDEEHRAVNDYIVNNGCLPYTSGCTMKLMGIGSVEEKQADMLMCPMLQIQTNLGVYTSPKKSTKTHADVFVTNSLKASLHILTCDFLLHNSPCLISHENQTLNLSMSLPQYILHKQSFHMFSAKFSGGSFVMTIFIENEPLRFTVDTGAPGPINIGASSAKKLKKCRAPHGRKVLKQQGVNGEVVCSELVELQVNFCNQDFKVPCFINNLPTDHVDGYVGLGFLRAFDILISVDEIGFSKNNLSFKTIEDYSKIASNGTCGGNITCLGN